MARFKTHIPLNVFLNNRHVGRLDKEASGAIRFAYDDAWLNTGGALPVSLSLPLRETPYGGAPVSAVFDNLLPDNEGIRKHVAERVGAEGTDAYSLLAKIGRDCVGALQFLADGEDNPNTGKIEGEVVDDTAIEAMLANLRRAPLGMDKDDHFRISIAGAQEKTALLRHNGQWKKPIGATPTTHIFKPQIGTFETGSGIIDLSDSVENEFYCLKLMEAFGLPVTAATIETFGARKVLVVERFDRRWRDDGRLMRLPQEDCCQALSVPPSRKYQNEGGPAIAQIITLLKGSDTPNEDMLAFFKSQIIFWLIGATDGHGKNFSVFLMPGARYHLTPFYDVLTAQPSFDANNIRHRAYRLAMSLGDNRHYKILEIRARHFRQTAKEAGLSPALTEQAFTDIENLAEAALENVTASLPVDFPSAIHESVKASVLDRLHQLTQTEA